MQKRARNYGDSDWVAEFVVNQLPIRWMEKLMSLLVLATFRVSRLSLAVTFLYLKGVTCMYLS